MTAGMPLRIERKLWNCMRTEMKWAFVIGLAALARLVAFTFAMPPYAGLDEIYHAARISFVMNEGRNPSASELSVSKAFHKSMEESGPAVLPDFVWQHRGWPYIVASRSSPLEGHRMDPGEAAYLTPNYEAQQPSPYYFVAATAGRIFALGTPLSQLRTWRLVSLLFAAITVFAAMMIGRHYYGMPGLVAGGMIAFLPTWHTLMLRASNDAMACAGLAVGMYLSITGSSRFRMLAESSSWALAVGTKLLTWPALVLLPFVFWKQRATKVRILCVSITILMVIAMTAVDLRNRTGVPIGLEVFAAGEQPLAGEKGSVTYFEMLKITIASGIWMSGQHVNALTPAGMALYAVPIFLLLWMGVASDFERGKRAIPPAVLLLVVFGAGQIFHAVPHVRNAIASGARLPLAGKEGWYWFALASFVVPAFLGLALLNLKATYRFFLCSWILLWDGTISVASLWRDYAGLASPEHPSPLFRWGPAPKISPDVFENLSRIAVGPFATTVGPIYLAAAVTMLIASVAILRSSTLHGERESGRGQVHS